MEFYSFRFGDMKVAQADAASPQLMAVEMTIGFKIPDQHTVETLSLTVHVAHDPDQSVKATQQRAYDRGMQLLRAAADYGAARTPEQLCEETEKNRAFVIKG